MRAPSILALLFVASSTGWTQPVSIEGRYHDATADKVQVDAPGTTAADLGSAPEVGLEPLEADDAPVRRTRAARRVGRVRDMATDTVEKGSWAALPDGRFVWRLSIRSPEAAQLRVHFKDFNVGAGKVWIYSAGQTKAPQVFTGSGLFNDGDFWTSTVSAERVTIEYLPESGLREDKPPFQIAAIGHFWEPSAKVVTESASSPALSLAPKASPLTAASGLSLTSPGREIAGCHLDASCYPEYRNVATGVVRIFFAVDGGLYVCSASLVNTKSGIGTPLLLTASHCIDNEESARSVQANFFNDTESCGGNLRQTEDVLGANYLVSESFTKGDYSLIRLLGLPPSPVYFFGIATEEPAIGAKVTGIHLPEGSYKRITFGTRTTDESIAVADDGGVFVSPADNYYQIQEDQGRTEGGSSGSPLLNANKQVVGTLSSGPVYSPLEAEDEVLMCLEDHVVVQYGRASKAWLGIETFINDLRPARMALPQAGDKFAARKVKFQWSPGVGVTEYRLLVGKKKGGSEYADVTLRNATAYTVENLPEDGTSVYVQLMSLVDRKWDLIEYSYLASSGSPARAAQILAPSINAQLQSSRVEFKWDEGSNVSEYMLYVGSTPGGVEYARRNAGTQTSAVVENLPGNGQTLYARLYSRVGDGWVYRDAVYRASDSRAKTFTLTITNRLAYPVAILVNDEPVLSVLGNRTFEQILPRSGNVTVQWQLVRPAHPVTGIAAGEALTGKFPTVAPADALSFEITNTVNGANYFTPVVTNSSNETFYVEVNNGTPSRAGLGAIPPGTNNAGLGYYRVQPTSSVRGYYGFYGYSGPYVGVTSVANQLEQGSGVVRVGLTVPAQ